MSPGTTRPARESAEATGRSTSHKVTYSPTDHRPRASGTRRPARGTTSDLAVQHPQQAVEDTSATDAKPVVLVLVGRPQPQAPDGLGGPQRMSGIDVHVVQVDGGGRGDVIRGQAPRIV